MGAGARRGQRSHSARPAVLDGRRRTILTNRMAILSPWWLPFSPCDSPFSCHNQLTVQLGHLPLSLRASCLSFQCWILPPGGSNECFLKSQENQLLATLRPLGDTDSNFASLKKQFRKSLPRHYFSLRKCFNTLAHLGFISNAPYPTPLCGLETCDPSPWNKQSRPQSACEQC